MSDQNLDYLEEIKRREEQVIKDIEEMDSSLNLTEYERKESKDEEEESKDETEKEIPHFFSRPLCGAAVYPLA